jgi:hypothetical protein
MYLLQISRLESDFLSIPPNSLSNWPGRSIPAQMIVLDGRKCTLFDAGTGGDQILVTDTVGKVEAIPARVLRVVPTVLLSWIVARGDASTSGAVGPASKQSD